MNGPRISLLLADTMRSRAYAQAIASSSVSVDGAMVVRSPGRQRWGQASASPLAKGELGELFVPNLETPLVETLLGLEVPITTSDAGTINDPEVVRWIKTSGARLVVFSGFGGEIVCDEVLQAGAPLLHVHSGWLPDYRGSTTLYYSYLRDRNCGATAIYLMSDIDTGPMLVRRRFPPPPPGIDVDYLYDSMIRAEVLIEALRLWQVYDGEPPLQDQSPEGTTYYVIHPVLKHVALNHLRRS